MININSRICVMRGTLKQFQDTNITLLDGEIAYITDTGKIKIGYNNTPFNELPYIGAEGSFKGTITSIDQLPSKGNTGDQYILLPNNEIYIFIENQWIPYSSTSIPIASNNSIGGVRGSDQDNSLSIDNNGIPTINNISADKIINGTDIIILSGGQTE